MAYSINLVIDGKKTNFKRTQAPFLNDITKALTLQQHQMKTFGSEEGPTDKQLIENQKDIAQFASDFFNSQFTAEEFIHGAHADAVDVNNKILGECLGTDNTDDSGEAKK